MRVLFTTNPGLGHLHPMVPIAEQLTLAGHEVAFACAASFCPKVEALGFRAFPAGLDWLESQAERFFPALDGVVLERHPAWFLKHVFADTAALRMVPDLVERCRVWLPDLLVRNDWELGACIASEILDIPHATISVELFLPARWWRAYAGEKLAGVRAAFGLDPYPAHDEFHQNLYLSFVPPSFQFPEYALPPEVQSLRPLIFDRTEERGVPAWIDDLPALPTVYATLGTVFNHRPDVFQSIVEGLRDEPINLIVTLGSDEDPERFGPQPRNVHIERYIPQSLLLPRCDAAITHAGHGTTLAVLMHGLPSLAIPVSATDPYRALRCVATGAGLALNAPGHFYTGALRFPEVSPRSVRDRVRELLDNPEYRANSLRLREEAMALPGPERAVELLMGLASRREGAAANCANLAN